MEHFRPPKFFCFIFGPRLTIYCHVNINVMNLLYSRCVYVMPIYYVNLLYVRIMLKKWEGHVKIIYVRDQK
jgi:hypothetical protein